MWTTEEKVALAKVWRAISENSQHGNARKKDGFWCEVLAYIESKTKQEGRRMDKARAAAKNKGSKALGSSTINDDALARLMVNEMTAAEVEQRGAFMELKRREVECREREIATKIDKVISLALRSLDRGAAIGMDEIREKIKAKYNLQY
nr:hypothetical protein [Tanacetum cinerariifolium]